MTLQEDITERTKFTSAGEKSEVEVLSGPRQKGGSVASLMLFERSSGSIINPQFDSRVLNTYYDKCSYEQTRRRLRYASAYLIFCSLVWLIYFSCIVEFYLIIPEILSCVTFAVLIASSFTHFFFRFHLWLSFVAIIIQGVLLLTSVAILKFSNFVDHFSIILFSEVLQIICISYTLFPLRLYMTIVFGIFLSAIFEICLYFSGNVTIPASVIAAKIFFHLALHLMGFHLFNMSQVRRRSTFLKLCEGARIKRQLKKEKTIQTDMISSLMPESIAKKIISNISNTASPNPFFVDRLADVSVLFADIVGFTNMSSNKTAPHLVYLLNDLFGRFDEICDKTGCEKIATLGDCYYCVSGCPVPKSDHAECCVEMGRAMCVAIQTFDDDHDEKVGMRVGVHTGSVMCGIVGTKRFKFDVYSNDVTLANEMESSGKAGKVHISAETYGFVKDIYELEDGEPVPDIRKLKVLVEYYDETTKGYAIKHTQEEAKIATYFVLERLDKKPPLLLDKKHIPKFQDLQQQNGLQEAHIEEHDGTIDAIADLEKAGRGSSDSVLVADMNAENESMEVFYRPPVNNITLNFIDDNLESTYRTYGLGFSDHLSHNALFDNPRLIPLIDLIILLVTLIFVSIASFLVLVQPISVAMFVVSVAIIFFILSILIFDVVKKGVSESFQKIYTSCFSWYPRNVTGLILITLPSLFSLSCFVPCLFTYSGVLGFSREREIFADMFLLALVAYSLFTWFSSWSKSISATVVSFLCLILVCVSNQMCVPNVLNSNLTNTSSTVTPPTTANGNITANFVMGSQFLKLNAAFPVACILMLILIIFLNREYDVSFRLSFNCDHSTNTERKQMTAEKDRGEWLLHNIIPYYIENEIKVKKSYSKNLTNVGVVFASISNFHDFYEEQFAGGTEIMRVLNDYFQDIESLLEQKEYKDVEKIKSVGSCLMLASGLNTKTRNTNSDPNMDHNFALLDFSVDLLEKTEEFNDAMFNFRFELKIGYNIGEVTAGVIGSTKLLYDIWGDTVNVSSRMYSTGIKGRIQLTEEVSLKLEHLYNFEQRGLVYVKGKDHLKTCLLVKKKEL